MNENKDTITSERPIKLKTEKMIHFTIHNSASFYSIFETKHVLESWKDRQTYAIIFLTIIKVKIWKNGWMWKNLGFRRKNKKTPWNFGFDHENCYFHSRKALKNAKKLGSENFIFGVL